MTVDSVDPYLTRSYVRGKYDCLDFTREVWLDATGHDLRDSLAELVGAGPSRQIGRDHVSRFDRLDRPVSPCLVLMRRKGSAPHVGVYLRGSVLHLHERGVEFQPLDVASRGFQQVRFYRCKQSPS